MLRHGTKDPYQRETEETERLVREAPKVKPPRRDRRRETIEPDRDPDLSQHDPDLSKNFKDIGGSLQSRVAQRWLLRQAEEHKNLVRVRNKDTGHVTYVTRETLQEKGGEYEVADEKDDISPEPPQEKSSPKEEKEPKGEEKSLQLYRQIHEAMRDDPAFESLAKSISDPKVHIGQLPNDFPLDKLKGFAEKFPLLKSFKTMGDARQAIHSAKNLKNLEKKHQEKREQDPKQERPTPEPLSEAGAKIREQAKNDPALKAVVDQLDGGDPKALLHLRHQINPSEDASSVVPGLPPEVKTLGDVVDALEATRPKPNESEPSKKEESQKTETPSREEPPKSEKTPEPAKKPEKKERPAPKNDESEAPPRRPTTHKDQDRAERQLIENFPVEVSERLLDEDPPLHPDDVRDLVEIYHTAKMEGKDEELSNLVKKGGYATDLKDVRPPVVGVSGNGEEVPFDQLTGAEKATALRKHQMFVLGLSLAARDRTVDALKKKVKAPEEVLGSIADFSLHHVPDETHEQREARASTQARGIFGDIVKRGLLSDNSDQYARWQSDRDHLIREKSEEDHSYDPDQDPDLPSPPPPKGLDEDQIKKLLEALKNDPASQSLVVGYGMAADYLKARHDFLDPKSSKSLSEHRTPKEIIRGLQKADDFFDEANEKYPEELRNLVSGKDHFRNQVTEKIRTLAPEKYPFLRRHIQEQEFDEYERNLKSWEKDYDRYQKDLKKFLKEKDNPYRSNFQGPTLPEPPQRPAGYLQARGSEDERDQKGSDLLNKFRRSIGELDKTASQILRVSQRYSSCRTSRTMAPRSKSGVYWGVDPYPKGHEGFEPYHGWQQARVQNLEESDLSTILAAARSWLRAPLLSEAVEGIYRDTQLRAALDLAIRSCEDGRYSEGLHPTLYNRLLSRLGGTPEGDTLLTDRGSLYASGDTRPMKHSQALRQLATRYASENPVVAYDLLALSSKFAEDEQQQGSQGQQDQKQGGQVPPQFLEHQKGKEDKKEEDQGQAQQKQASAYQALRSAVIRMASANRPLIEAYKPLLDMIKQLG